jgi:hypothetical protein
MIKVIARIFKKPGMSNEEFNKYWLEVHGPLTVKAIPGLKKYNQNHLIMGGTSAAAYRKHLIETGKYDQNNQPKESSSKNLNLENEGFGIVEIYFEDFQAFHRFEEWLNTEEGKNYKDVEEDFQDRSRIELFGVFEEIQLL